MKHRKFTPSQIKRLRKSLGWTQQRLAEYMRIRQSAVSNWESGLRVPSGPSDLLLAMLKAAREDDEMVVDA